MISTRSAFLSVQKFASVNVRCMGTQNFKWKPSKRKPNKNPKFPIILKEDHQKLGRKWQIVAVERGYARNFLIPQGLAAYATPENLEKYNISVTATGISSNESGGGVDPKTVAYIEKAKLEILRPENVPFEINEHYVAYGCKRVLGLYVPPHAVTLPCKITEYGDYIVTITINGKVDVPLKLRVGKLEPGPAMRRDVETEGLDDALELPQEYDEELFDPMEPEI